MDLLVQVGLIIVIRLSVGRLRNNFHWNLIGLLFVHLFKVGLVHTTFFV